MYAGSLNQFHDARGKYILTVADSVNLNLFSADVFINQYGLIDIHLNGSLEIMLHILRLGYYLHSPSAKHEAGTHKHRIANLFGSLNALLNRGNCPTLGLWNIKLLKQSLEGASILCLIYGSTVRSDYLNSSFAERLCKIDCSLSA